MVDQSFTLQAIMEMQKTLGGLVQSVDAMKASVDRHTEKIEKLHTRIVVAGAVIATLLVIGGYVLHAVEGAVSKLSDRVFSNYSIVPNDTLDSKVPKKPK